MGMQQQAMQMLNKRNKELQKGIDDFFQKEFEMEWQGIYVKVNGKSEIKQIKIDKTLIDPEDPDSLQDILSEVINRVLELVREQYDALEKPIEIPGFGF